MNQNFHSDSTFVAVIKKFDDFNRGSWASSPEAENEVGSDLEEH